MTATIGIGWVSAGTHGAAWRGMVGEHEDLRALYRALRDASVIPSSMANFARYDDASRRLSLAVGLALHDAGIAPCGPATLRTGLLLAGPDGAHSANVAYFRDYVAGGRKLGRGNLFIYTLPTSPGAEAAISFGLNGPLLYVGRSDEDGRPALRDAEAFVASGQADTMLCALSGPDEILCFVLGARAREARMPAERTGWPERLRRLLAMEKGTR